MPASAAAEGEMVDTREGIDPIPAVEIVLIQRLAARFVGRGGSM